MKLTLILACLLTVTGCVNSIKPLTGTIGPLKLYRATAQSFSGPNISALYAYDGTNAPTMAYAASGDGIGHPIIKAIGNASGLIGGAAVLGSTLRPASTSVHSGNLDNQTFAQGGEVVIPR